MKETKTWLDIFNNKYIDVANLYCSKLHPIDLSLFQAVCVQSIQCGEDYHLHLHQVSVRPGGAGHAETQLPWAIPS